MQSLSGSVHCSRGGRKDLHYFSSRHGGLGGFVRRIERSAGVIDHSVTGATLSWASCTVRDSKGTPRGSDLQNLFVRGRGQSGALNGRGVCALEVARAQSDTPQLVMRAHFEEAALASVHEGQAHFLVLGEFCQVASKDETFAFLLPEILIEVAYMTVEAFLLPGIVGNKYCQECQVVAE